MAKAKKSEPISVFREVSVDEDRLPLHYEVSLEDAARFLGVSGETFRRYIADGKIEAQKQYGVHGRQGWRWVVSTDEVNRAKRSARMVPRL